MLKEIQRQAVMLLSLGNMQKDVAGILDVSYNTLDSWKMNPEYQDALKDNKKLVEKSASRIFPILPDRLLELIYDDDSRVALGAIVTCLQLSGKLPAGSGPEMVGEVFKEIVSLIRESLDRREVVGVQKDSVESSE